MIDLYKRCRHLIKTADLIEWRAHTFLGWAIRKKTGAQVNHTSGALLYKLDCGNDVRRYIGESLAHGFELNYLSDQLKNYKGSVYLTRLKPEYDALRGRIAQEALKLEGKGYGYRDLVSNLVGPVKLNADRVICSEAWHIALIRAGLLDDTFNSGMSLVPGEFWKTNLYLAPIQIY